MFKISITKNFSELRLLDDSGRLRGCVYFTHEMNEERLTSTDTRIPCLIQMFTPNGKTASVDEFNDISDAFIFIKNAFSHEEAR